MLVGAQNGRVRVAWANRAFYALTGRAESIAGVGLSECKITLRRKDPITGAIERWKPKRALPHGKTDGFNVASFGTKRQNSYDTWTCDVENVFGEWRLSQAVVAPVSPSAVPESARALLSEGTSGTEEPVFWGIQIMPLPEPRVAQELIESTAAPSLDALSEISELLLDVAHPMILHGIAEILVDFTPAVWSGFFVGRDDLLFSEGITAQNSRRPSVRSPHIPISDGMGEAYSLLVKGTETYTVFDPDGEYPERTAEFLLQTRLKERWREEGFECRGLVTIQAIEGRELTHGLMVCVYPELNELQEVFAIGDIPRDSRKVYTTVVRRVGMAIENVQLYEREHQLAQTLQQSMLPTQDIVEELDLWTYYAPSSDHARVGGDWFDISYVRERAIGIVVGDVVGHDIEAAAAMGQLRLITRSYGFECDNAVEVLEKVDNLVEGLEVPHQASLVYARLKQPALGTSNWGMEYIRAGHLPPVLIHKGKPTLLNEANGSLIGFRKRARSSARQVLVPGDIVVLYTDGLIERRDRPMQHGLQRLLEVASEGLFRSAKALGEYLLSKLADAPEDDMALVILRVPQPGEVHNGAHASKRVRASFASEPGSVGRARKLLAEVCAKWNLPPQPSSELVLSELVSNAVVHGWGQIILRLFQDGGGIRIEVEDRNPTGPRKLDGHLERSGGYGIKIVDKLSDWGWEEKNHGKIVWAHVPLDHDATITANEH